MTEEGVIDDILRAMNAGDIKQRTLAKQMGLSEARISQMLTTGSNMTLRSVERIWAAIRQLKDKG